MKLDFGKGREEMNPEGNEKDRDVMDRLAILSPKPADAPRPAPQALARFRREVQPPTTEPSRVGILTTMFKRRYALAGLSFALVLVAMFTFPAVRAVASDFLGLFRVQKFAPISISPAQLAMLEEIAESGLYPGEVEIVDDPGQPEAVPSLGAAETFVGHQVRSAGELGQPDQVFVMDGGSGRLTVDVANSRSLLELAGIDPLLIPDELEGAVVDVTIYPAVSQSWDDVVLLQTTSPLVAYPDNVDTVALGEALLQLLGMDSRQAHRLATSIDWTNTLLLPIPANMATFGEIRVEGVSGLALSSLDGRNHAIIWEKDGMVYLLTGSDLDALEIAANALD